MFTIGAIGFTTPWLLLGLVALPILWLLLRAVPPAPIRRLFPGVALLLGLLDDESQTDKTPWWLLLLRTLAVAAIILGFAGPILNPREEAVGTGPLLIVMDGTWADARDWAQRIARVDAALDEAGRLGRPVAVALLTDPPAGDLPFQAADVWKTRLPTIQPAPWSPDPALVETWVNSVSGTFDTFWMSDGLARESREAALETFEEAGTVTVFQSPRPVFALRPAVFADGLVEVTALRDVAGSEATVTIAARGLDPTGIERELARADGTFDAENTAVTIEFDLPAELRNRVTRFEIAGARSAGAVSLTDDALRRREVALLAGIDDREGLELLSPLHFLQKALAPTADLIEGDLLDVLLANPDVIVLADVATVSPAEEAPLLEWVRNGGLLLRFAGPRLASSDVSRAIEHPLMPVRLRAGGRNIGGAMSWGEPKGLRPFSETSPFFGLTIPEDVLVSSQVMAQPDPELSARVIASLADGTPLVTRKRVEQGQVVLFHVTANAEWSTLPLSGLFVQMLERLAVSTRPAQPSAEELAGTTWVPDAVLDAFGVVEDAGTMAGIPGERLAGGVPGADMPPGLYTGDDRRVAINVLNGEADIEPAAWPASVTVTGLEVLEEIRLIGWLLASALALLCADIIASLWISGRLSRNSGPISAALIGLLLLVPLTAEAQAQEEVDPLALVATTEVVLAYVVTGDPQVDRVSEAGLRGLSQVLWARTSIEPADPIPVNLEMDELAFFPFLYWPVADGQPIPSTDAYAKLNRYLRHGGMILFDTRDADIAGFGASSVNGRKLQRLAGPLDVPPLEPIPQDHVLTRTFYLLQDFPGRHQGRDVWVEAAPPNAEQVEGMPFRNLNDNVTPIVIGGNDWAAAWAVDANGQRMFPIGRGFAGERQREMALRFGVNLIMHVLTGNYKSDQVHVPALLDRLGQ
ncbi:MAG: DUF4159 domain-containing protein [Pseudomonadota bacterium]